MLWLCIFTTIVALSANIVNASDYILTTFADAGLLTRDGSTGVDSVNLIRCIEKYNLTGNITVGVSIFSELTVVSMGSDVNDALFRQAASECHKYLGFRLSFATWHNVTELRNLVVAHSISEGALLESVGEYNRVTRNRYNPEVFTNNSSTLMLQQRRSKYYAYYAFRATQGRDCDSNEEIFSPADQCNNYASSFSEFEIYNPNVRRLIANVWPHHHCSKGDFYVGYYGPGQTGNCVIRTSYSWYGNFDGDDCYGHESSPLCANLSDETFNNKYNPRVSIYLPAVWDGGKVPSGA